MICKKCGNQIKDGFGFCPYCGAAVEQEKKKESEWTPEVVSEEEMKVMFSQEAPFSHRVEVPQKPKKKGKKGLAIVGVILAVIVLVGVFSFQAIAGMVRRTFSSPESYYSYVESKEMKEQGKKWADSYDNMVESMEDAKTGSQSEISIEMSENMQNMLEMMTETDLSWLDKVSMSVDSFIKDESMGANAELELNDKNLLSATMAADMKLNKIYLILPELSKSYLGFSLEDYDDMMSNSYYGPTYTMSDMMKLFNDSADVTRYIEDGKTIEELVERYSDILFADAENVLKTKETLEVDGISQECTALTVTLTAKDIVELLQNLLEEVKNDQDIKKIVETLIADMKKMDTTGELDENISYEAFVEEIAYAQEELVDLLEVVEDTDATLVHVVYVGKNDEIIGRKLVATEDGEEAFVITYKRVENKKDFAMELSFSDGYQTMAVEGNGTVEKSKENSTYKVLLNGMSTFKVDVKDYDVKAAEDGYVKGTFVLSVDSGAGQLDDVDEQMMMIFNAYQLKISCDTSKDSSDLKVSVMANGEDLISIGLSQKYGNKSSVNLPKASDTVYDMLDEAEMTEYLGTLDWDALKEKINGLDIPQEYKNAVDYYLGMMGSY